MTKKTTFEATVDLTLQFDLTTQDIDILQPMNAQ